MNYDARPRDVQVILESYSLVHITKSNPGVPDILVQGSTWGYSAPGPHYCTITTSEPVNMLVTEIPVSIVFTGVLMDQSL